jgi:hydrogenase expression/formation protein HypD
MKHVDEYRDRDLVRLLASRLTSRVERPLRFMEVCGTHTMNIFRFGLRSLFPAELEVVSGPGCPVCVTAPADIDACVAAAESKNVIVATFGDLVRVPGSRGSLAESRSRGARVEIVYSPIDALELARAHENKLVVFVGIGFETTVPTVAAVVAQAARLRVDNFCVLSLHKVMPPVFDRLLTGDHQLDGLLCPGHVATIVGRRAFEPLALEYGLPCVIGGFEPVDIMQALVQLAELAACREAKVVNAYPRAVAEDGNPSAWRLATDVFRPVDAQWRGLGTINSSGLAIRDVYAAFDARRRLDLEIETPAPPSTGCRCGDVICGRCRPVDCGHFGGSCTPGHPLGPCMVSSEGSCAAFYRYGERS